MTDSPSGPWSLGPWLSVAWPTTVSTNVLIDSIDGLFSGDKSSRLCLERLRYFKGSDNNKPCSSTTSIICKWRSHMDGPK